jgi:hypothetical protein
MLPLGRTDSAPLEDILGNPEAPRAGVQHARERRPLCSVHGGASSAAACDT